MSNISAEVKTTESLVTDRLRELILSNQLPTGEFLSQRDLADKTGSSVISVRGALRTLESEGFVESVPKWGVRIPIETEEKVKQRYEARLIIELAILEKIHGKLTPTQIKELQAFASALDSTHKKAVSDFAQKHRQFHLLLATYTENPFLEKLLGQLLNPSTMILNAQRGWAKTDDKLIHSHVSLVKDILSPRLLQAKKSLTQHIKQGLSLELSALN